jgi:DNA-binding FadR family transcriptional regulator
VVTTRHRALRRLERRPLLSQTVQKEIKSYVIENKLRPGDPLPSESTFAQQLGVSRNSVREAAKSLETLGFIEARVGSGLFVGRFSIDLMLDNLPFDIVFDDQDFAQSFDAREYLELGMAHAVFEPSNAEAFEGLRGILTRWRTATEAGEYPAELDLAFHLTLSDSIGNHVVSRLVELLWEVRNRAQASGAIPAPLDLHALLARHEAIALALESRDASAYREAIIEHYAASRVEANGVAGQTPPPEEPEVVQRRYRRQGSASGTG